MARGNNDSITESIGRFFVQGKEKDEKKLGFQKDGFRNIKREGYLVGNESPKNWQGFTFIEDIEKESSKRVSSQSIIRTFLLEQASRHLEQTTVARASVHEVPTGIEGKNRGRSFRHQSVVLAKAQEDPRFHSGMQVMIDLDSTLFPLDRAMREMGVDISPFEANHWDEEGDDIGDLIMRQHGREDLLHGLPMTEEQQGERIQILIDFFEELHDNEELMKRAGVYEFAPQIIRDLRAQGVRVHIVTHRSTEATEETLAWLESMGIEYDEFVCDQPDRADKIAYCKEHNIPVLLDDKPRTIRDAEAEGIEAISLAWPYSQKALTAAGGDEASCWREMGDRTVKHLERITLEKAEELGIDLLEIDLLDRSSG